MSSNHRIPDYDLDDPRVVSSPQELRAMADPLRSTILELLLERAATVGDLAAAVERPKSTVAHHVGAHADAGMLGVARARRVCAIVERSAKPAARHEAVLTIACILLRLSVCQRTLVVGVAFVPLSDGRNLPAGPGRPRSGPSPGGSLPPRARRSVAEHCPGGVDGPGS